MDACFSSVFSSFFRKLLASSESASTSLVTLQRSDTRRYVIDTPRCLQLEYLHKLKKHLSRAALEFFFFLLTSVNWGLWLVQKNVAAIIRVNIWFVHQKEKKMPWVITSEYICSHYIHTHIHVCTNKCWTEVFRAEGLHYMLTSSCRSMALSSCVLQDKKKKRCPSIRCGSLTIPCCHLVTEISNAGEKDFPEDLLDFFSCEVIHLGYCDPGGFCGFRGLVWTLCTGLFNSVRIGCDLPSK